MKHLFYIHSHITFLASIKSINFLKLDYTDCVFIIHRGKIDDYKFSKVKMVEFIYNHHNIETYTISKKFWKNWKKLDKLDEFINIAISNNYFTFYTPHTYASFLALIVTHKKCKGYNIIEEGLGSYLKKDKL